MQIYLKLKSIKSASIKRTLIWFLPVILSLSYVYIQKSVDVAFPKNDAAEIVYSAQQLYAEHLKSPEGISWSKLYTIRDFRRTLYPFVIFSALTIFNGNLLLALDLVSVFFWIGFLIYTLLTCHKNIGGNNGLLIFWLISCFPSFFSTVFIGTLELPLLFCISAICFHLFNCNNFNNKLHTVLSGVFISLGLFFRPAELFAVLFLLYIYLIIKYKLITPALALIYILLASLKFDSSQPAMIAAVLLIYVFILMELFLKKITKLWPLFLLPFILLTNWYHMVYKEIWSWIYFHNFTAHSAQTGRRIGLALYEFWASLYIRWGFNSMVGITLASLVAIYYKPGKQQIKYFLLLSLPLIILIFFGSFTNNGDPRYYYAGLYIFFLGLGLLAKNISSVLFRFLIISAVVMQLWFNYLEVTNTSTSNFKDNLFSIIRPKKLWPYDPMIFYPVTDEPLNSIATELTDNLPNEGVRILSVSVNQTEKLQYMFDSVAFSIAAKQKNLNHIYTPSGGAPSTDVEYLKKHFDYIVMGPLNLNFSDEQSKYVTNILEYYKSDLNSLLETDEIKILSAEYKNTVYKYALIKLN